MGVDIMLNLAVCDDERIVLQEFEQHVEKFKEETNQNIKTTLFQSGEDLVEKYHGEFDVIFLDIQMGGMNGIQIAREIREMDEKVVIVFLTSIMKYVLEGYKVNAKNYLMKPLSYQRFKIEMEQLVSKWKRDKEFILVKNDSGKYIIYLNQIIYIETFERNTLIHREQDEIICYKTMKEHEDSLKDNHFYRVHSSYIVNLSYISEVVNNEIKLITGDYVLLSKNRKKSFMDAWLKFLGDEV